MSTENLLYTIMSQDGNGNPLPTTNPFNGPFNSLEEAVNEITKICKLADLVPPGIKILINTSYGIREYLYKNKPFTVESLEAANLFVKEGKLYM